MATDVSQDFLFVGLALLVLLPFAVILCCFCRLKKLKQKRLGTYDLTKQNCWDRLWHGHGKQDSDSDHTTVQFEDTSNPSKRDDISFVGMKKRGYLNSCSDESPHVLASACPKRNPDTRYFSWPNYSFPKPVQRASFDLHNLSATVPPESLRSPEINTISVLHHHSFDYEPRRSESLTLKLSAPTAKPKATDCNIELDPISLRDVCYIFPENTEICRYTDINVVSHQDSVCLDTLQTADGTDPGPDINEASDHFYREIIDCEQTWNESESGSEAISLRPWSRQRDNSGSSRKEYEAETNNSLPVTAQHSPLSHISDQQEASRWNVGNKGSVGVYSSIEVVSPCFGLSLPRPRTDFGDSGLELDASDQTLLVHVQNLSALDKDPLAQVKRLPVPDQDLSAQDHSLPAPDRDLSAPDQNPPVPDQDSYSASESQPVDVANVSTASGDSSTLDGTDRDSSCGGDAEPIDVANVSTTSGDNWALDGTDRDSSWAAFGDFHGDTDGRHVADGGFYPGGVPFLNHDNWCPLTTSSLRRHRSSFYQDDAEDSSTQNHDNDDVEDTSTQNRDKDDVADSSTQDSDKDGVEDSSTQNRDKDDVADSSTQNRDKDDVEDSSTQNSDKNDVKDSSTQNRDKDDVKDSSTQNRDNYDDTGEDFNVQQTQEGSQLNESNGEDLQAEDIDEADIDPSYGVVPGRDLSLTKETLEHTYVNLTDTYTASVSTQTSSYNKNAPRPPSFSPGWQFFKEMTSVGGCLQGDDSDVRLEVPVGAIPAEECVTIRGAISVDIGKVYAKVQLEEFEFVASPIAEYDSGKSFRFQSPVQLFLPHFLPQGFSPKNVNVYQFTRDQFGNITHHKLQLREKEINSEKGDAEDRDAAQLEGFCFGKDGQICILTTHFSGFVCTHCGRELPHPALNMDLYASHEEKARGGRQVKVRLEVWDNRLFIKDFREYLRTTATWQQGQELNRTNLVLMDRKTLPALAVEVDVTEVVVGFRLEVLSEDDVCDWEHKKRTARDELCFPVESTMELKRFVPCACQSHIPQVVDWLLAVRPNASPTVSDVFECLVDVGYVSCVDRNSNVPVRFLPEPRYVTIHVSVSKTTVQQRSSEDVNNNAGFPELEYPSWISNDLSAVRPNQFSQTQRKMEPLAPPSASEHRRGQSSPAYPRPDRQSHGDKLSHVCSGHQNVSGLYHKPGIERESHVSVCHHPCTCCGAEDPSDETRGGSERDARGVAAMSGKFPADSGNQLQGNGTPVLNIQKLNQLVINPAPESPRPPPSAAPSPV